MSENMPSNMCAQQRFGSTYALVQSDQNLQSAFWIGEDANFFMRTMKIDHSARMQRLI